MSLINRNKVFIKIKNKDVEYTGIHNNTTALTLISVNLHPNLLVGTHLIHLSLEATNIGRIEGNWPNLRTLNINDCRQLELVEINAPTLATITLRRNNNLSNFILNNCTVATQMSVNDCVATTFFNMPSLKELSFSDCEFDDLNLNCPNLQRLVLDGLHNLLTLPNFVFPALTFLHISNCAIDECVFDLQSLENLKLYELPNLRVLSCTVPNLELCSVSRCRALPRMKISAQLRLENVTIERNDSLNMILIEALSLKNLRISDSPVTRLDFNTTNLENVHISGTRFKDDGILMVLLTNNKNIKTFFCKSSVNNNDYGVYHRVLDRLALRVEDMEIDSPGPPSLFATNYPPMNVNHLYLEIFNIPLERRLSIYLMLNNIHTFEGDDSILQVSLYLDRLSNPSDDEIRIIRRWRDTILHQV